MSVTEVREEPAKGRDPDTVRTREAERLLARVPDGSMVVACDERGKTMTSPAFAQWLQQRREEGRDVAILIGGAFGLGREALAKSSSMLALASWTLPHELARVVLAEQLYRASTIVRR